MDNHTAEQRRKNMQAVRSKNSKIEIALRKAVWAKGLRYRKNYTKVPGKPDIVFVGKKIAVFVDGEFWHGYDWENRKKDFKSHRDFWIPKIEQNIERDRKVNRELKKNGWKVIRFWGKEISQNPDKCAEKVFKEWRKR